MKLYNNLKKLYDNLKKLDDRLNNIDDKLNNMDDRLNKIDDGLKEIDDKLKNKSKDNLNKNFNKVYKNVFPPKVKTKTNANSAVKKQIGTFMAFGSKYADKITNEDTEEGIKTDVLKNLTLDNGKEIPKYIVNALVKGIVYSDYIMPDPKVYGKSKFAGFILSILTIFAFSPVAISVYKLFKPDSIAQPVIVLCSTGIALMSIIEKTSGWKINGESNYKIISCLKKIFEVSNMIILLIISTKDTDSLLLITIISLSVVILLLSNKKTNFLNKTEWRNFAISLVLLLVITLVYFFCVPEKHLVIDNAHVIKTKEKDGKTQLLAYINDDLSKSFLVRLDGKTKAVKDALINVSGNLDDRTDYDTKLGGSNIVPTIDAKKVTVVGHSED